MKKGSKSHGRGKRAKVISSIFWDAIIREVGDTYIYPMDETRVLGALQGLKDTIPEGKVLIDEEEYEMLKAKSDIEKKTPLELILIGLAKFLKGRG